MFTGEMFEADKVDQAMLAQGVAPDLASLRAPWIDHVTEILQEATLEAPPIDAWMQKGGKQGVHTEKLGYLLAEMQFLQRAYPGATW
ncbi:Phenylacetic acid catabolic protein [Undibacterium arcticum]